MDKKKVLIVGLRGTVGSACASLFEENGYQVIGTTSDASASNDHLLWLDFNNDASVENFSLKQTVDHLIIASGAEPSKNLHQTSKQHLQQMMNIHVTGPMLLLQKIVGSITQGGCIIFLSSPAALKGSYDPGYAAAKGATNALIKTLAKDIGPGVRINGVSPGLIIDSTVYRTMTPDFRERHLNNALTKKLTTAAECAEAVYFMCMNKQITGQVLQVSGGMV